jgi:hypothetical protein
MTLKTAIPEINAHQRKQLLRMVLELPALQLQQTTEDPRLHNYVRNELRMDIWKELTNLIET